MLACLVPLLTDMPLRRGRSHPYLWVSVDDTLNFEPKKSL